MSQERPDYIRVNGKQAVEHPEEGSCIEFKNIKNTLDIPFVIYADMESILTPLEIDKNNISQTIKTHEHIPCTFGYKVVCKLDDKLSVPYKTYKGKDCIEKLYECLFDEDNIIIECIQVIKVLLIWQLQNLK